MSADHEITVCVSDVGEVARLLGDLPPLVPPGAVMLLQSYDPETREGRIYQLGADCVVVVSVTEITEKQLRRIRRETERSLLRERGRTPGGTFIGSDVLVSIVERALNTGPAERISTH